MPAREAGAEFEPAALEAIIDYTEGYPFFLQEYGKAVWNLAATSPITLVDTLAARDVVDAVPDQDFFPLRGWQPPRPRTRLRQSAGCPGPGRTHPRRHRQGHGSHQLSNHRLLLPQTHRASTDLQHQRGRVAFTAPQFDRYVARAL